MQLCQVKKCPVEEAGETCQCVQCRGYRRANRTARFQFTHEGHVAIGVLKVGQDFYTSSIEFFGYHTDCKHTFNRYYFDGTRLHRTTTIKEQYGVDIIREEWMYTAEMALEPDWQLMFHYLEAGRVAPCPATPSKSVTSAYDHAWGQPSNT